jgi:hypothetical protein
MQDIALRIITAAAVTAALVLYLYESGARRIVDIAIAAVAFVATLPLFAVLAAASSLVNMRVFDRTDDGLTFSYPQGALRKLPFLLSVMSGKRHILPIKLFGKKKKETLPI